jgi:ubiquinol-cytochrome c reductase cytochrome c subunit
MKHLSFLVVALAACGGTDSQSSPDAGTEAPSPQLFADNCAQCHGSGGDGTVDAPQIRNPVHAYATYWIRNGRDPSQMGFADTMPSFTETDLPDLTPIFAWLDRTPRPTDGQGLFLRFCGNCHGADATGGRVGEDIAGEESDDVAEKVREGHGGTSYAERTKYMPAWSTSDLTETEVTAIAAYLATLPGGGDGGDGGGDDD